jgi:DNA-binding NtrC family response regulator
MSNDVTRSDGLVGRSGWVAATRRVVRKIALSRCPVLISGETGTGKEVVARAIYAANPVGQFVTIDCASLAPTLVESELFGHAKGAFTGAFEAKAGLFERAHGGTALLDEVGELPLEQQSKLLRVLQEKEVRRVGSSEVRRIDCHVISATNRDLKEEIKRGRFREDLYYRLNVAAIRIPPLRDHTEDIGDLVRCFIERYRPGTILAADTYSALIGYQWPGNVRELEHCIQRLLALSSGPIVTSDQLPSSVFQRVDASKTAFAPSSGAGVELDGVITSTQTAPLAMEDVERLTILQALEQTKGDRTEAARMLRIGRTTLYRKLKMYERLN